MFTKTVNGHEMEIQVWYEQGGATDDVVFWCHTCDPTGEKVNTYDLRWTTLEQAFKDAMAFAEDHAGVAER